ncbi:MAG: transposase [Patescibacteria group bacterium]
MLNSHRPPHIFKNDSIYFISSRTFEQKPYFNTSAKKKLLMKAINGARQRFSIEFYAWVILDNHYHLLARISALPQFATPDREAGSSDMNEVNVAPKDKARLSAQPQFATPIATPKYQLVEFIRKIHKDSARYLNEQESQQGRKIWYQYFDHCIRDEADFWKHFNYIHQNPVKHGFCKNLAEVFNYPFSSARSWSKIKGEEWFDSCFEIYPIVDFIARE